MELMSMHGVELPLHPRPQLARDQWVNLRGAWDFAYDDHRCGLDQEWQNRPDVFDRAIVVPIPPESPASGIGDTAFHPVVWYRRTFAASLDESRRLLLHFGAVDYRASVWVNGQLVVTHEGGHTPFSADITTALREDGDQVLVVRAEDDPSDLGQPRGKQDWLPEPHQIWYHRTTGIWQPVWLESVLRAHIVDVRWTPDVPGRKLGLAVAFSIAGNALLLRATLRLGDRILVDDMYSVHGLGLLRDITLERAIASLDSDLILWSPEQPSLIDVTLTLLQGDRVLDGVRSYAGLRSVSIADGRFLLNGQPRFLRMVLEQEYWPESHLAAPGDDAIRREVALIREAGFIGVRIHQKIEDPRFLYWCDRLGVLVWGEMPAAYLFSPTAATPTVKEWIEALHRDYSHPSIVAWVPFNESWGVAELPQSAAQRHLVRTLYHLTTALDSTRPVIGNDGWEHVVGDIITVHDYSFDSSTLQARYGTPEAVERTLHQIQPHAHAIVLDAQSRRDQAIMVTEYGGIGYRPDPAVPWYGYGTVADQGTYLAKYRELAEALLDCPSIAGFCYTQLTDTLQETNGLFTEARTPKLDLALLRAVNARPSLAVPGEVMARMQDVRGEVPWVPVSPMLSS
jgi:beta-galactosidase/beta-glucuronidase